MAEIKNEQNVNDIGEKGVKETKKSRTKLKEVKNLFPLSTEALEVLSRIYSMSQEEWEELANNRDKEIAERPMLFLAQKMCTEFGIWTVDLIKYFAVLNGLDLKVDNGGWFIKIERENDER